MKGKRSASLLALVACILEKTEVAQARLSVSNAFGSVASTSAYERATCQPVFQVTTPWGSPYMLFEKYKDEEKAAGGGGEDAADGEDDMSKFSRVQQKDDMQDVRPVSLYFVDEHDARALADEMKQMKHMKDADLRITCTSLGKALRQASHLGRGLPTGQPIDGLTGRLLSMDDGGSLRHKIVPSKRDLFYAARCAGRERLGLFADSPKDDADLLLQPQDLIEASNMALRRKASKNTQRRLQAKRQADRDGLDESPQDRLRREYSHMEGHVGLPLFHCMGMARRPPPLLKLLRGASRAWARSSLTPLYFSYEDLLQDWTNLRQRSPNKSAIPETPPDVQVYNLMDIVTTIDKEQWKANRRIQLKRDQKGIWGKIPIVNTFFGRGNQGPVTGLENIVFVPSSLSMKAKHKMSQAGNRKARLRPMRAWGPNS